MKTSSVSEILQKLASWLVIAQSDLLSAEPVRVKGFLIWIGYQCLCREIVAPQVVALITENLPSVIVKARFSQFSLFLPISLWGYN